MITQKDSDKKFLEFSNLRQSILIPTAVVSVCSAIGSFMPFLADSIDDAGGIFNVVGFNLLSTLLVSLATMFIQLVLVEELKKRSNNPNVLFMLDCLNRITQVIPILLGPILANSLFSVPYFASVLSMVSGMSGIFALSFIVAGLKVGLTSLFEFSKDCLTAPSA